MLIHESIILSINVFSKIQPFSFNSFILLISYNICRVVNPVNVPLSINVSLLPVRYSVTIDGSLVPDVTALGIYCIKLLPKCLKFT